MPKSMSYLPDAITLKTGEILKCDVSGRTQKATIALCKKVGAKYRTLTVLSNSLKGKTDLYGKPYKGTNWIFTNLS